MNLQKLLQQKIDEIVQLRKEYDKKGFRQWHKEVELLLERVLGQKSRHLEEFRRLDGICHVILMDDEENDRLDRDAYFRDLNGAESLLKAVVFNMSLGDFTDVKEPKSANALP